MRLEVDAAIAQAVVSRVRVWLEKPVYELKRWQRAAQLAGLPCPS